MANEPQHIELPAPPTIRLSLGAVQVILLIGAITLTWWLTKRFSTPPAAAMNETVTAQLEKLTAEVTQLKGNLLSQAELEKKIKAEMGADFNKAIAKQNGTLNSLAVAVGKIPGDTADLIPPPDFTVQPNGGFKGATLVQNHTPPTTEVKLDFDPTVPNGLTGKWNNYTLKYTAKYGEWRTEHDGIRAAMRLQRESFNGGKSLGTEEIPLETGDLFVSTDAVARTVPQPKYTFSLGTSYDVKDGKPRAAVLVSKQFTPTSAVTTGYVNQAWTVMYSFKLDWAIFK